MTILGILNANFDKKIPLLCNFNAKSFFNFWKLAVDDFEIDPFTLIFWKFLQLLKIDQEAVKTYFCKLC